MKPEHGECRQLLIDQMAQMGAEIIITVRPDHKCHWWDGHSCPHGVTFWVHPSEAQFQRWKDGGFE